MKTSPSEFCGDAIFGKAEIKEFLALYGDCERRARIKRTAQRVLDQVAVSLIDVKERTMFIHYDLNLLNTLPWFKVLEGVGCDSTPTSTVTASKN